MRFETIRSSATFDALFKQAKSWHTSAFVCFYQPADVNEVGYVASKKVGGSVQRNRAKRRLRALFRAKQEELAPGRYLLVAKRPIIDLCYKELVEQFDRAIKELTYENRIGV